MPISERCFLIEPNSRYLSVVKQCELLSIHRSRYYYEPIAETAENLSIMLWLDKQYFDTPFYGVLRYWLYGK
jgi:putative transposase